VAAFPLRGARGETLNVGQRRDAKISRREKRAFLATAYDRAAARKRILSSATF
jgi:hypothetical protein